MLLRSSQSLQTHLPGRPLWYQEEGGSAFYPQPFCQENGDCLRAQAAFKNHKTFYLFFFFVQNVPDLKQIRSKGKKTCHANGEKVLYNQHE